MASFVKYNAFVEKLAEKVYNLGSDTLVVALSNSTPTSATAVLSDVSQITYTNLSSRTLTVSSSSQTSGTYSLVLQDLVLTSSGGTTGPFRYAVIYDDTAASDDLIGYYDYGSSITLQDGETFTLNFGSSVLTLA